MRVHQDGQGGGPLPAGVRSWRRPPALRCCLPASAPPCLLLCLRLAAQQGERGEQATTRECW
jgi:hypothetical protein